MQECEITLYISCTAYKKQDNVNQNCNYDRR